MSSIARDNVREVLDSAIENVSPRLSGDDDIVETDLSVMSESSAEAEEVKEQIEKSNEVQRDNDEQDKIGHIEVVDVKSDIEEGVDDSMKEDEGDVVDEAAVPAEESGLVQGEGGADNNNSNTESGKDILSAPDAGDYTPDFEEKKDEGKAEDVPGQKISLLEPEQVVDVVNVVPVASPTDEEKELVEGNEPKRVTDANSIAPTSLTDEKTEVGEGNGSDGNSPIPPPEALHESGQRKLNAALERARLAEAELQELKVRYKALQETAHSEHITLEKAIVDKEILSHDLRAHEAHDKEVKDFDKFLTEIAVDMTDEQLASTITNLVEEYLLFCDFRNTMDCFTAEAKCVRFKPNFGLNLKNTAVGRAEASKKSLLASFDGGDEPAFFSTWLSSVPPSLVTEDIKQKTLKLKLQVHFATFALKKRIAYDPLSPFPCSATEIQALDKLKQGMWERTCRCSRQFHPPRTP